MGLSNRYILLLVMSLTSCSMSYKCSCEDKIEAYLASTINVLMEEYYVSVPVRVGNKDDIYIPESRKGFVVIRGLTLYDILSEKRSSTQDFGNYIFRLMVEQDDLLVSQEEYQQLMPYIISLEDGGRYKNMNCRNMVNTHSKGGYLTSIDNLAPDYYGRCIVHHFVNNGFVVKIEHESPYLSCLRIRTSKHY